MNEPHYIAPEVAQQISTEAMNLLKPVSDSSTTKNPTGINATTINPTGTNVTTIYPRKYWIRKINTNALNKQRCELTRIIYCTAGVRLQRLILAKTLQDFTHIILDEVHERDQSMDFSLILIRTSWLRNYQNVKIVLMSA
ncbi:unnamed protein product, partial [Rotaria sordida]